MQLLKYFIAIIIATTIYIVLFINYKIVTSKDVYKIGSDDDSVPLVSKYQFTLVDKNSIKFEDLIDKYCNVRVIENVTHKCLTMLNEYDLSKLNVEFKATERIYYHTFWDPDGNRPHHVNVMELNILSFLATQDLNRTKLIIWRRQELKIFDEFKARYKNYIDKHVLDFRLLNFPKLCSAGIFNLRLQVCESVDGGSIVHYSDFVRFLVLYSYGGIYVDGDVIFLRDMKYFWDKNFVYRWSFTESYNTAVMGIRKERSNKIEKIYEEILTKSTSSHGLLVNFYPSSIKDVIARLNNKSIYDYEDFHVYNSVLFDPAWLCFDTKDCLPFNKTIRRFNEFYDTTITESEYNTMGFYPGAFAYHLHLGNCGSCKVRTDNFFFHVQNYFKSKIPS